MYYLANTTVTILRGFVYDVMGDLMNAGTAVYTEIDAFISSPSQSAFRPIILGTTVYEPGTIMPSTVRDVLCVLPGGTDLTEEDQILDETTGITYAVVLATQPGTVAGITPDMQVTLRRVTTTQPA